MKKIGEWKKVDFKEVVRGIGGMADIRYWIKVKIGFGGKMTEVMAAVMDDDFDEKILVGLDVLIPLKAKIDLEKMELRAKEGKSIPLTGKSDSRKFYVVAAKTERLEPGKIKWIVGNIDCNEKEKVNALIMAADEKLDVPSGVFTVRDGEMELPVVNRDSEETNLKRGERIAHWREIEVDGKAQQQSMKEPRKPLSDEEIEKKCATPALERSQRERLLDVLKKHKKVFIREDEFPEALDIR